ncbi:apolipoprotein N-acyltransferase [Wenxinia saemankumensis]|uniref:Apolipoprotein N-acyltransferase n=1 Tax=Wenxinia saemankumensis TaxID=1447782 RepID=A0A1M6E832_9RHOB|nr:apolipoprotein N-acyltransferase [Wenxinia saemankumensis]SHI81458.1 apolipoprotein N-acyltransferase [Wenxinia saemankumensis]
MRPWLTGRLGGPALVAWGVVAGAGQAPWWLWPLTLLALALGLREAAAAPSARGAAGRMWLFGAGYFGWTLQWIVSPFLVEPEVYGWMAPFALILSAGGFALFWGAAGWLGRSGAGAGRPAIWAVAALLGLAEAARSLVLTGFPWAMLGHVWIDTGAARLAALGGPHLLTALTLLGAASLASALAAGPGRGRSRPGWLVPAALPVLAALLPLPDGPAPAAEAPLVRIVQPNVPQDEKWSGDVAAQRLADLQRLGRGSGADPVPADLVVWPETALPWPIDLAAAEDLKPLVRGLGDATLVTGLLRWQDGVYYNSLLSLDPGGTVRDVYDKVHLVPFGEYVPLGELAARLGIRGLAARDGGGFAAGGAAAAIELDGIGTARPLICYEGIFAEEVGLPGAAPRLLLLVTNDAWFGTRAGPQQHLAQARLRAIEQGVPLVRAANTGISAMIDARGRITASLPLGVQGALDAPLPPALAPPPYARWGDGPALLLMVLAAAGAIAVDRGVRRA